MFETRHFMELILQPRFGIGQQPGRDLRIHKIVDKTKQAG
jgi:hypothetical protein